MSILIKNSIGMSFRKLDPGAFWMGATENDEHATMLETRHKVTLTKGFYMGQHLVTRRQYKAVIEDAPSEMFSDGNQGPSDDCPVLFVSWYGAVDFCTRLNQLPEEIRAGNRYRLPTEAEWEYACRAGSDSIYCFGDDEQPLEEYCWFEDNSDNQSRPVGLLKPNNWNLYDMHGNAAEWCSDWFEEFTGSEAVDPKGPHTGDQKSIRNGDWGGWVPELRCAFRDGADPDEASGGSGMRLVLDRS